MKRNAGHSRSHLTPIGVDALADHPYHEWISEYAGETYQDVVG